MKKVFIIWIWWIWISAIARYFLSAWYEVFGQDRVKNNITLDLEKAWAKIFYEENEDIANIIDTNFEVVVYTNAINKDNIFFKKAKLINLKALSYPEAVAKISNNKNLVCVAWTHWKSTTSSMISIALKNNNIPQNAIIWTLLKEFWWKNATFENSENFILESCEYAEAFLNYSPNIAIITNIEADHLDYYKTEENYFEAFKNFAKKIKNWWYLVYPKWEKIVESFKNEIKDINFIEVWENYFELKWKKIEIENLDLKVPWEHILLDAKLSFAVLHLLWLDKEKIKKWLESYSWVWRRMEKIREKNDTILMSDYAHHPVEVEKTLYSLKQKYSEKELIVAFQPHQYARTITLINGFKNCFKNADKLYIPDIYESRDSKEDKGKMPAEKFFSLINFENKVYTKWLENLAIELKNETKQNKRNKIILLLWAWNIDDLRYKI